MALSDWTVYVPLLDALREQRGNWDTSKNFTEFDQAITRSSNDLRGGENSGYDEYGLDSLVEELREDFVDNYDLVYEQIRLAALATERPDLGEDWAGCFVSKRSDGTDVWSENRYTAPSAWEKADLPAKVPTPALIEVPVPAPDEAPALTLDPETGLLYDAVNWYLKDGKTIVTEVGGTDYFVDPKTGIWYRNGEASLWPDLDLGLMYDDVNWYLKDGKTIVTEVEGTDEFVDPKTNTRYRNGEPVLPVSQPQAEPEPAELPPAAERQLVAKLVEVRTAKVAELFDELQEGGWSPAETPEEAAELRAQGDQTAFTVEEILKMLDTRVEQLLGA